MKYRAYFLEFLIIVDSIAKMTGNSGRNWEFVSKSG